MPAIGAIGGTLETVLRLVIASGLKRVGPILDRVLQVVRVQHRLPAPVLGLFERHAAVVEPALVVIIQVAVRPGGPDDLRHGLGEETVSIGEKAVTLLAFLKFSCAFKQRFLRPLPFGDVGTNGHVLRGLPGSVQERNDRRVHPVE